MGVLYIFHTRTHSRPHVGKNTKVEEQPHTNTYILQPMLKRKGLLLQFYGRQNLAIIIILILEVLQLIKHTQSQETKNRRKIMRRRNWKGTRCILSMYKNVT